VTEAVPRTDGFRRSAKTYLERLEAESKSPKTVEGYEYELRRAHRILSKYGTPPSPRRFSVEHAAVLEQELSRKQHSLRTLSVCLTGMGCPVTVRYKVPPRTHVRWLSLGERHLVTKAALELGMPYLMALHLELDCGFRRVSVCRAMTEDFKENVVRVRGKGKDYLIPPNPLTAQIFPDLHSWRAANGWTENSILIPARSRKYSRVGLYSESGMDGILARVSERAGVRFSNHDLRRTFGRDMWKARVPIEKVSKALGHEDIRTTIDYLGIDLDDMASAIEAANRYTSASELYLQAFGQRATRA
jgi:integrase/recombinase XerD